MSRGNVVILLVIGLQLIMAAFILDGWRMSWLGQLTECASVIVVVSASLRRRS